jgi:hypothetical protein
MLQAPIPNLSSVFLRILQVCLFGCCICFHTYDASVLSGCCVCLQWFQVLFQVFLQVGFRRMFQMFVFSPMLHLDVSKLDRTLHLPSRLSAVSLRCQARGGPHMLVGRHSRRDVGGQARDVRRGAAARVFGRQGLASGCQGPRHAPFL